MSGKQIIQTDQAPKAIGPYSQAVKVGNTVYFSGQIALDPTTMEVVAGDISQQAKRVFENMKAVAKAAGGELSSIVKLTIFLTDLGDFSVVNQMMTNYFQPPFPARSTVQVSALPKGVGIEIEAVMVV